MRGSHLVLVLMVARVVHSCPKLDHLDVGLSASWTYRTTGRTHRFAEAHAERLSDTLLRPDPCPELLARCPLRSLVIRSAPAPHIPYPSPCVLWASEGVARGRVGGKGLKPVRETCAQYIPTAMSRTKAMPMPWNVTPLAHTENRK